VQAFACDLDRTLIGPDGLLGDRTRAAIARTRASGRPFVLATGRMYRSARPYLERAGISEPAICYQGAVVVDPRTDEFLLHEPLELGAALDALAVLREHGHVPNVYVDDELYVSTHTDYSRRYSEFQGLTVTEVGDLEAWLDRPPTKLVVVLEPDDVPALRAVLASALGDRVFLTTSLPYFLELGSPAVSKGSGLRFVAERLGLDLARIVSFGDGENDVELIEAAGFGIAVEEAHPRLLAVADSVCPGPERDGVADVIEAYLDSLA
jgi:Cof subfamily protein (haloacid dehalogenase superfamily)